jgi:hypothetical protein
MQIIQLPHKSKHLKTHHIFFPKEFQVQKNESNSKSQKMPNVYLLLFTNFGLNFPTSILLSKIGAQLTNGFTQIRLVCLSKALLSLPFSHSLSLPFSHSLSLSLFHPSLSLYLSSTHTF